MRLGQVPYTLMEVFNRGPVALIIVHAQKLYCDVQDPYAVANGADYSSHQYAALKIAKFAAEARPYVRPFWIVQGLKMIKDRKGGFKERAIGFPADQRRASENYCRSQLFCQKPEKTDRLISSPLQSAFREFGAELAIDQFKTVLLCGVMLSVCVRQTAQNIRQESDLEVIVLDDLVGDCHILAAKMHEYIDSQRTWSGKSLWTRISSDTALAALQVCRARHEDNKKPSAYAALGLK